jgi:hypothetical protein
MTERRERIYGSKSCRCTLCCSSLPAQFVQQRKYQTLKTVQTKLDYDCGCVLRHESDLFMNVVLGFVVALAACHHGKLFD